MSQLFLSIANGPSSTQLFVPQIAPRYGNLERRVNIESSNNGRAEKPRRPSCLLLNKPYSAARLAELGSMAHLKECRHHHLVEAIDLPAIAVSVAALRPKSRAVPLCCMHPQEACIGKLAMSVSLKLDKKRLDFDEHLQFSV